MMFACLCDDAVTCILVIKSPLEIMSENMLSLLAFPIFLRRHVSYYVLYECKKSCDVSQSFKGKYLNAACLESVKDLKLNIFIGECLDGDT